LGISQLFITFINLSSFIYRIALQIFFLWIHLNRVLNFRVLKIIRFRIVHHFHQFAFLLRFKLFLWAGYIPLQYFWSCPRFLNTSWNESDLWLLSKHDRPARILGFVFGLPEDSFGPPHPQWYLCLAIRSLILCPSAKSISGPSLSPN
jgi:hypothetical protein